MAEAAAGLTVMDQLHHDDEALCAAGTRVALANVDAEEDGHR